MGYWKRINTLGKLILMNRIVLGALVLGGACLWGCFARSPQPIVAASVRATRPDGTQSRVRATSPSAYQHYLAGTIAYEEGRYNDALQEFLEAFAYDSEDPYLSVRVAELLWRAGDLEQAEKLCREAMKDDPSLPEAHLLWGKITETRGDFSSAQSAYRRAIRLAPNHAEAYLQLGSLLLSLGETREAEEVFAQLSQKNPDAAVDGYYSLAQDALDKGEETRAIRFLQEILAQVPTAVEAAVSLGELLEAANHPDEAMEIYRQTLEASGDDARLLLPLFSLSLARGLTEEAERYAERLHQLALRENSTSLLEEIGRAYLKAKHPRAALRPLILATEISPSEPSLRYLLGLAYHALGETTRAIEELERAEHLSPEDPQILYHLGEAYAAAGQEGKAREAYLRALKSHPQQSLHTTIQEMLKKLPPDY